MTLPAPLASVRPAVILAEVATDRASTLSEPAGELLAAYLAEATALVRQAIPEAVPTPRAAADGRPGDTAREGAGR